MFWNFSPQVFGLGNSTYEHYNKMGKDVDVCLEKAGGVRISALGLGKYLTIIETITNA